MTKLPAKLILSNGIELNGYSFGYKGSISGELVFNTAMTGYPESLTDPSYRGQLLVLTYPLIGNYGVPFNSNNDGLANFFESENIHISGLVISNYSSQYSHWNAQQSLGDWLTSHNIPGIEGIDTRMLTQILRDNGAMSGKIVVENNDVAFRDPNKDNLVDEVSTKDVITYGNGKSKILLVDLGVKFNIIRNLLRRDTTVIRVPWDYDFTEMDFDGLMLSNGPGDPKQCIATIENIKIQMKKEKPIFGICLGNQLLALASGADTYKLKFGHRSHNQPVILNGTQRAFVTSQNHGFAINDDTLNEYWKPYFTNLNDNTNEGLKHTELPFFSVQFHPEASSGPVDTEFLFDDFINLIEKYSKK